jgi:hypothetical protein
LPSIHDLKLGALHPKQSIALRSRATEILFGGAAGPGKSHLMRIFSILFSYCIPGLQTYLFRRELGDLEKNHLEGPKGYKAMLAPWTATGVAKIVEGEIRFWNGARIWLCHCKNPDDVYGYQGAEIHLLLIDELTQWLEFMYRYLRGRVRAPGLVMPEFITTEDGSRIPVASAFPRILASANPGGVGHQWVKRTWIEGVLPFTIREMSDAEGGMVRQFIPAVLEDNPTMAADDPSYERRLRGLGSEALVRALRFGDWDIVAGAFFDKIRPNRHYLKPWTPPKHWTRFLSMDWGSAKPFSIGWWVVVDEDTELELRDGGTVLVERGAIVRYKEWYGVKRDENDLPIGNEGLKLLAEDVGRGIRQRLKAAGEVIDVQLSVADPSMWKEDGGPSIMERLIGAKPDKWDDNRDPDLVFQPADNTRIAGWQQVQARIGDDDNDPLLYVCANCTDWIRTVPVLQHDDKKAEDIDTDAEDHAGDDTRYACMSRPTSRVPKKKVTGPKPWSLEWVIQQDKERRARGGR